MRSHRVPRLLIALATACVAVGSAGLSLQIAHARPVRAAASRVDHHQVKGHASHRLGTAAAAVAPRALSTGGPSWTWQNPSLQGNTLTAIACSGTGACTAVGDSGVLLTTATSGNSWSSRNSNGTSNVPRSLRAIACPSTCVAVGDGATDTTGSLTGSGSWTSHTIAATTTTSDLRGVSCSGATCFAVGVGGTIIKSTDTGASWNAATSPTAAELDAIKCSDASHCIAVGVAGTVAYTTNGTSWSSQTVSPASDLSGISCPSSTTCYLASLSGTFKTTNATAAPPTWARTAAPTGTTGQLRAISCPSTSSCTAVGDGGIAIATSNGTSWSAQTSNAGATLFGVTCPSTSRCTAVGYAGIIDATGVMQGATWTPQTFTATNAAVNGVSCSSSTQCNAAGDGGLLLVTTNAGANWSSQPKPTGTGTPSLAGISCPSTTTCYAVGATDSSSGTLKGTAWKLSSGSWTALTTNVPAIYMNAITCPLTTTCFVAGDGGNLYQFTSSGTTWTKQTSLPAAASSANFNGISCVSTTSCVAVGDYGTILGLSGTTWSVPTNGSATTNFLSSVSCPGSTLTVCAAVGGLGTIDWLSSGNWSVKNSSGSDLLGVSCYNTSHCTAVGESGSAYTLTSSTGSPWSQPNTGAGATTNPLIGISCLSTTTFCTIVGFPGTILINTSVVEEDVFMSSSEATGSTPYHGVYMGGTFGGWETMGTYTGVIGAPTPIWNGAQLEAYALDGSSHPVWNHRTGNASWSGWSTLPGGGTAMAGTTTPDYTVGVVQTSDGNVRLFIEGTDGAEWTAIFNNGNLVSGWGSMGGTLKSAAFGVVGTAPVDVYAVGSDGSIWRDTDSGSGYGGWNKVCNSPGSGPTCPAFPATQASTVQVDIRGDGGAEEFWAEGSGTDKSEWDELLNSSYQVSASSNPSPSVSFLGPACAAWNSAAQLHDYGVETNNLPYRQTWTSGGGFTTYSQITLPTGVSALRSTDYTLPVTTPSH